MKLLLFSTGSNPLKLWLNPLNPFQLLVHLSGFWSLLLLFACSVEKYGHRKIHVELNIPIFDNIQNLICYRGNHNNSDIDMIDSVLRKAQRWGISSVAYSYRKIALDADLNLVKKNSIILSMSFTPWSLYGIKSRLIIDMNWEITTNRTRLTWLIVNSGTHSFIAISVTIDSSCTSLLFFLFILLSLWTLCTYYWCCIFFMCLIVQLCVSHDGNKGYFTLLQSSISNFGVYLDFKMSFDKQVFEACKASYCLTCTFGPWVTFH